MVSASVSMMLLLSGAAIVLGDYSETTAVSNLELSVSAYCGSPKYNATFLRDWECGPSCKSTSVTDITQFEDSSKGIFGFVGHYEDHCLVAFRGTSSSDGWATDFASTSTVPFAVDSSCSGCGVGKGFYEGYEAVRPTILSTLSNYSCKTVSLTGHSLGAALATIAAMDLGQTYTIKDMYNFGSPRAGDSTFASAYNSKFSNHWRVTHSRDPIPHAYFEKNGFFHIGQEAFYTNTTAAGYKLCQSGEDTSCADQYANLYGNILSALFNAPRYSDDHLEYMQEIVSYSTDGTSCAHVSVTSAVQQAYLSTAAYCEPEDLRKWDCGAPCDQVTGGVKHVQVLDVPFGAMQSGLPKKGSVRGFVGQVENRCVLSLRDLFDNDEGLKFLKNATAADLETIPVKNFKGAKVYRFLLNAWMALEEPLRVALHKAGCSKDAPSTSGRRLIVTGHGLGASLAALAAFQLKDFGATGYYKGSFGIEASFHFGATRIGNQAFAKAFQYKFGDDVFRVTHGQDPYVHYPRHDATGFMHISNELHFNGDAAYDQGSSTSYVRCTHNGEDPKCGIQHPPGPVTDHTKYLQPLVKVDMSAKSCKSTTSVMV